MTPVLQDVGKSGSCSSGSAFLAAVSALIYVLPSRARARAPRNRRVRLARSFVIPPPPSLPGASPHSCRSSLDCSANDFILDSSLIPINGVQRFPLLRFAALSISIGHQVLVGITLRN